MVSRGLDSCGAEPNATLTLARAKTEINKYFISIPCTATEIAGKLRNPRTDQHALITKLTSDIEIRLVEALPALRGLSSACQRRKSRPLT